MSAAISLVFAYCIYLCYCLSCLVIVNDSKLSFILSAILFIPYLIDFCIFVFSRNIFKKSRLDYLAYAEGLQEKDLKIVKDDMKWLDSQITGSHVIHVSRPLDPRNFTGQGARRIDSSTSRV
ncbi:hypothetical protein [Bifidobacterium aerophilum]|uniref:hypothetical protein n=1 Tax=Bifidobacterium aerophilum TaxID=1798155 RepID=UPI0013D4B13F|nr:hypothetical protein [Bifidobacterium aerophilum]